MAMEYIKRVLAQTKRASTAIILAILVAILCTATLLPSQSFAAQSLQQVESKPFENQLAKSYARNFCISLSNGLSQENAFAVALRSSKPAYINPSQWLKLISEYTQPEHLEEKESIASLIAADIIEDCGSNPEITSLADKDAIANELTNLIDGFS